MENKTIFYRSNYNNPLNIIVFIFWVENKLQSKYSIYLRMNFSNHPSQKFIKFKKGFSCNKK